MPIQPLKRHREQFSGSVTLRAIAPDHVPLIWDWMQEFPKANFDDYGPKSIEAFKAEVVQRVEAREVLVVAYLDDDPVGVMTYAAITDRLGTFHGLCFAKRVHGTGVAAFAVSRFIDKLFGKPKLQGVRPIEKIQAAYFEDNAFVERFLKRQGFQHEGKLRQHTLRGGKPVNCNLVALYRDVWTRKGTN